MSSALVGIGPTPVEVPPVVHALTERLRPGATVVPVWRNEYGGLTVRLEDRRTGAWWTAPSSYLKWVPDGAPCPNPLAEADRDPRWRTPAERSAVAVGLGLRRFHDALPTDTCPFVRTAHPHIAAGISLGTPPPVDRLVVCHGDATVPNTLLDQVGRFAAHVDVGDLGVADRWSDIAVTTRSVSRRFGPGLEPLVLAAYGIAPDRERTAYYRALWDAEEAARAAAWTWS